MSTGVAARRRRDSDAEIALTEPASPAMKSVLMLSYFFPPLAAVGVFRTLRFVKYLPEFGWSPLVTTVDPQRTHERVDPALAERVPANVPVRRTGLVDPERWLDTCAHLAAGRHTAARPVNATATADASRGAAPVPLRSSPVRAWLINLRDLMFATPDRRVWWVAPAVRAAMRAIGEHGPSALYTTGPPHSTHLAGLIVRRMTGIPWLADFRDPWARQPWGAKEANPWGQRLIPTLERACIRGASAVVLNTERMAEDFRRAYRDEDPAKFVAVTNGFDPEMREELGALRRTSPPRRPGDPVRLCHAGSIYHRRDLRSLLEAIRKLVDAGLPIIFEQLGTIQESESVRSAIATSRLEDHVLLSPPVSHREALNRQAAADVLVLIQPDNELQVPGKLYEMMLFGSPILALVDDGAAADIVREHRLGVVAGSSDADRIAAAIVQVIQQRDADNQRRALEEFNGRELTRRLAGVLQSIDRRTGRCPGSEFDGGDLSWNRGH